MFLRKMKKFQRVFCVFLQKLKAERNVEFLISKNVSQFFIFIHKIVFFSLARRIK